MDSLVKLIHGDCFVEMQNIPNGSIDLIITDPPYLIPTVNGGGSINKKKEFNKILETSLR